jgi:TM2 domain-containing membrane protein YozV
MPPPMIRKNPSSSVKHNPTSRIPMLLSALVCPGAGQFMQGRWRAGLIYAAGFLWGFFWLMFAAGKIIISYYRMAFDSQYEPDTPNVWAILPPLAIALTFYLVNLFDIVLAQLRISREKETSNSSPDG